MWWYIWIGILKRLFCCFVEKGFDGVRVVVGNGFSGLVREVGFLDEGGSSGDKKSVRVEKYLR